MFPLQQDYHLVSTGQFYLVRHSSEFQHNMFKFSTTKILILHAMHIAEQKITGKVSQKMSPPQQNLATNLLNQQIA